MLLSVQIIIITFTPFRCPHHPSPQVMNCTLLCFPHIVRFLYLLAARPLCIWHSIKRQTFSTIYTLYTYKQQACKLLLAHDIVHSSQ
ncbi:hypothetical protein GDO78_004980 [Eleutherodactylus coqui]|uniref:Uncharacterized protein n=1 Tax=Eleutherodactylus coqui TaxID=57060 RepID=A0A8J6FIL7_ELECQ|nr:hypothetical protein GDO78_004980 [Eleutherodactylus coqui]